MFALKVIREARTAEFLAEVPWLWTYLCRGDIRQIRANDFQDIAAANYQPRLCGGFILQKFSFGKVTGPIVNLHQVNHVALAQIIGGDNFINERSDH